MFADIRRIRIRDQFHICLRMLMSDQFDHRLRVRSEADVSRWHPAASDRAMQMGFKH
jgi:hypothetical protein